MIPDPEQVDFEDPTGPDFFSDNHSQYNYDNCYGGDLFDNDPDVSAVDWRIFINSPDPRALAYALGGPYPPRPGSEQWNPCRNDFRATTWDNSTYKNDPMTLELEVEIEGSITLAYYFVDSDNICRDIDFTLSVDGVEAGSGTVTDFADGKYAVFEVSGLTGTTVFRLDAVQSANPTCDLPGPGEFIGVNSVISSVYIGGEDCRTECPDEPEEEDDDSDCEDDGGDDHGDDGDSDSDSDDGDGDDHGDDDSDSEDHDSHDDGNDDGDSDSEDDDSDCEDDDGDDDGGDDDSDGDDGDDDDDSDSDDDGDGDSDDDDGDDDTDSDGDSDSDDEGDDDDGDGDGDSDSDDDGDGDGDSDDDDGDDDTDSDGDSDSDDESDDDGGDDDSDGDDDGGGDDSDDDNEWNNTNVRSRAIDRSAPARSPSASQPSSTRVTLDR